MNVQALEIVEHQRLAAHEVGHAAAALMLGLHVESARAPYWTVEDCLSGDPDEPAGQVNIPAGEWDRDPRSPRSRSSPARSATAASTGRPNGRSPSHP